MMNKGFPAATIILILCCNSSYGLSGDNELAIHGFFTGGLGILSSDDVELNGYDESPELKQDSIFGLQISHRLNDEFSLTGQLVARGPDNFDTELGWAYATYTYQPETVFKIGRVRLPLFFYSDQQEVGYTYPWIRLPVEVYQFTFSSMEAVDVSHSIPFSKGTLETQFYVGSLSEEVDGMMFEIEEATGAILKFRRNQVQLRAGYNRGYVTREVTGTPLEALVENNSEFVAEDYLVEFYSAALHWQQSRFFTFTEWTRIEADSALSLDRDGWLVQVGTYLGRFTPHLTYSKLDQRLRSGATRDLQKPFLIEEESITAGTRYDLDDGIALKLEIQYHDEAIVRGAPGDSAILYSGAIDMVF